MTSYQLYSSTQPDVFYADLNSSVPVLGFNAVRSAGERESYRVTVHEADYDRNVFYVLVAIDRLAGDDMHFTLWSLDEF